LPGWPSAGQAFSFPAAGTLLAAVKLRHAPTHMGPNIMAVIAIVSTILASHVTPQNRLALSYLMLPVLAICVLLFLCGIVAITEHSEWFNA
jgi:hypothetical protein